MLERRQDSSTRPSNPSRSEEILNDLHGNKLLMLSFLALSFAYQCLNTNSSLPPPLLRLFVSLSPLLVMSGTLSHEINFYMGKDEECECSTIRVWIGAILKIQFQSEQNDEWQCTALKEHHYMHQSK
jgi:hypothetical protein